MNRLIIPESHPFFQIIKDKIPYSDIIKDLEERDLRVFGILEGKKALRWPVKGKKAPINEFTNIPIIWYYISGVNSEGVDVIYDIHPTKCLPSRYNRFNPNSKVRQLPLVKEKGSTLSGCRHYAVVNGTRYECNEPLYCKYFGIPDDCYTDKFEKEMIEFVTKKEFYMYNRSEYILKKIDPICTITYIKDYLPDWFIYKGPTEKFLKYILPSSLVDEINTIQWYGNFSNYVNLMDLDNGEYTLEEYAEQHIEASIVCHALRELLLIIKKDDFNGFHEKGTTISDDDTDEIIKDLNVITTKVERELSIDLNLLIKDILPQLDIKSLSLARFIVIDTEFIHIQHPNDDTRKFNLPSIYSNILWEGIKKGFTFKIITSGLPCYSCNLECRPFKKNQLKYDCFNINRDFIEDEIGFIEQNLLLYENLKLVSYGGSDPYGLEQAVAVSSGETELRTYTRKNRKRRKRITDLWVNIAEDGMSLSDIEELIISKWLTPWARKVKKVNVNKNLMSRKSNDNWNNNIYQALIAAGLDTISCFLFYIFKNFRVDSNPIPLTSIPLEGL